MVMQRTICTEISCRGVGVHSGKTVTIKFCPAEENTGIVFRRVDLDPVVTIAATVENVGDTVLSTCLVKDGVRVATIEHLMAAIVGLGIDNIYIDINAAEVPIMDGSAAPFVFLLQAAGVEEQQAHKKFIVIKEKVEVAFEDKYCSLEPWNGFKLSFRIDFDHPAFTTENQSVDFNFSSSSFQAELCRARTFGFYQQFEYLKKNNLVRGGSLANAIVFDEETYMNKDPLRMEKEPVVHKVLDVIGDLSLLQGRIIGAFTGIKSGHMLNNMLLKKLIASPDCWQEISFDSPKDIPISYFEPVIAA